MLLNECVQVLDTVFEADLISPGCKCFCIVFRTQASTLKPAAKVSVTLLINISTDILHRAVLIQLWLGLEWPTAVYGKCQQSNIKRGELVWELRNAGCGIAESLWGQTRGHCECMQSPGGISQTCSTQSEWSGPGRSGLDISAWVCKRGGRWKYGVWMWSMKVHIEHVDEI